MKASAKKQVTRSTACAASDNVSDNLPGSTMSLEWSLEVADNSGTVLGGTGTHGGKGGQCDMEDLLCWKHQGLVRIWHLF